MQRYVRMSMFSTCLRSCTYLMVQGWSLITGGLCVEVFETSSTSFTVGTLSLSTEVLSFVCVLLCSELLVTESPIC